MDKVKVRVRFLGLVTSFNNRTLKTEFFLLYSICIFMPTFMDFPDSLVGKEFTCNMGDLGSIPGLGKSPGEGKGYPIQYSGLENSMDYIIHDQWNKLSIILF